MYSPSRETAVIKSNFLRVTKLLEIPYSKALFQLETVITQIFSSKKTLVAHGSFVGEFIALHELQNPVRTSLKRFSYFYSDVGNIPSSFRSTNSSQTSTGLTQMTSSRNRVWLRKYRMNSCMYLNRTISILGTFPYLRRTYLSMRWDEVFLDMILRAFLHHTVKF